MQTNAKLEVPLDLFKKLCKSEVFRHETPAQVALQTEGQHLPATVELSPD
jgi:hypothetical protein